ncbi:N5-carboxyaminoimidazole ribonucleotide synthase [Nocardioides baekrokdamisoli]|uniref:N5-carboxyaminoimidazole ribonucleotide synthase n=1 Tax=Nocardioides baekrokdamisoli TaxID=1804624 RepID=A0A3G9IC91_9ACTN|nr:5-(carboxyamino)imidazole ribonucleotide synthase [Nocardioides baekrokdamisoli]BBH16537.1 N5-carboxyaminoimidazole ribonucleotide synthase [Nocardioides baekrokdamisoli]
MTLAIIGGGQLARMMAEPAAALGIDLRLLAEAPGVSAAQVIPAHTVGDYRDLDALTAIVAGCEAVTFDHEHVPTEHLHALEAMGVAVRPGPDALVYAQDKGLMRTRLGQLGAPCPRNAIVTSVADVEAFGIPCVIKTTRGGYDGKGVWFVRSAADCADAFASGATILAEELVDFRRELSALVARSATGEVVSYPVVETLQVDGVCREVIAPAPDLAADVEAETEALARRIATELGVVGILAVELFETTDGRILVNELAMRPHNTGHWTQDGAVTSQFENHVRAVLGLPLGATDLRAPYVVMVNVLGGVSDLAGAYEKALADPSVKAHWYGKEARPGRKVGHVNTYGDDLEDCLTRARRAAAAMTTEGMEGDA